MSAAWRSFGPDRWPKAAARMECSGWPLVVRQVLRGDAVYEGLGHLWWADGEGDEGPKTPARDARAGEELAGRMTGWEVRHREAMRRQRERRRPNAREAD